LLFYDTARKTHIALVWIVLALAVLALSAELLPEVESKMIVIPTLVLAIALMTYELILAQGKTEMSNLR
jgi:hypothetical protein